MTIGGGVMRFVRRLLRKFRRERPLKWEKPWSEKQWAGNRVQSVALLSGCGAGLLLSLASLTQLMGRIAPSALVFAVVFVIIVVIGFAFATVFAFRLVQAAYKEQRAVFRRFFDLSILLAVVTGGVALSVVFVVASFVALYPEFRVLLFGGE